MIGVCNRALRSFFTVTVTPLGTCAPGERGNRLAVRGRPQPPAQTRCALVQCSAHSECHHAAHSDRGTNPFKFSSIVVHRTVRERSNRHNDRALRRDWRGHGRADRASVFATTWHGSFRSFRSLCAHAPRVPQAVRPNTNTRDSAGRNFSWIYTASCCSGLGSKGPSMRGVG